MTDKPVNLNQFRKTKARAEKKARADQNAVVHGLPTAARETAKRQAERARRFQDGNELSKNKDD